MGESAMWFSNFPMDKNLLQNLPKISIFFYFQSLVEVDNPATATT